MRLFFFIYGYVTSNNDIQPSTLITDQSPSGLLLWKKSESKTTARNERELGILKCFVAELPHQLLNKLLCHTY